MERPRILTDQWSARKLSIKNCRLAWPSDPCAALACSTAVLRLSLSLRHSPQDRTVFATRDCSALSGCCRWRLVPESRSQLKRCKLHVPGPGGPRRVDRVHFFAAKATFIAHRKGRAAKLLA
eukprot:15106015-Alexandrium_andersonii.AAC.1